MARTRSCGIIVAFLAASGMAVAADVRVPEDAPTIQAAIGIASDGDRVLVAPGVYAERIDLLGKRITIESTDGAAETWIDGGGEDVGWVVTIAGVQGGEAVLRGFTITGGFGGINPLRSGGGVLVEASSAVIESCVIASNLGAQGGGMAVLEGDAVVRDSRFEDNRAFQGGGVYLETGELTIVGGSFTGNETTGFGGAIAIKGSTGVSIRDTSFTGNAALNASFGGAMYINHANVDLDRLTFVENGRAEQTGHNSWTISTGGGGAIYTTSTTGRINASRFLSNVAAAGSALYIAGAGELEVVNCLFTGNGSVCDCGLGVLYTNTSNPVVVNNTFADNGGFWGIYNYGSFFSVANTIFAGQVVSVGGNYGLTTLSYSLFDTTPDPNRSVLGPGNVQSAALLDPTADYTPLPGSPAIDAGDNEAVPGDVVADLLGNNRFFDDPDTVDTGNGEAPIVDMGAIEFGSSPLAVCGADLNGDGVVDAMDLFMYLDMFVAGDARADHNGDGVLDATDFFMYLDLFAQGC